MVRTTRHIKRSRTLPLLILCTFAIGLAGSAAAEPRAGFEKGALRAGLGLGYGEGWGAFTSNNKDSVDVRMAMIAPSLAVGISELKGDGRWYRGSFEALLEAQFAIEARPQRGWAGAAVLSLRYNFLGCERLVPFIDAGVGVGGIDFDLSSQADGITFVLQGGLGAHWFVNEHLALTGELRWHHFSNAQIRQPNNAINTALLLIGPTFFFD